MAPADRVPRLNLGGEAVAIALTKLSFIIIGDGPRYALDPRTR